MAEEQERRAVCHETKEINPSPMMSALRKMGERYGVPIDKPVRMDQGTINFLEALNKKIMGGEIKSDEGGGD